MTSFASTVYVFAGQCCRRHVVRQQVGSDVSVVHSCVEAFVASVLNLHRVRKKWNHQYFRHNFDKQKYVVVIFAQNIAKVMRNQTNTTKVCRT